MRTRLHAGPDLLTVELGEMCALAASAMQCSTVALVEADLASAERVDAALARLDGLDVAVSDRAFTLLALQSPVAGDLRIVVSAIQIAADAHRMGGLAAHIARVAGKHQRHPLFPAAALNHFAAMGRVAVDLAVGVTSAVVARDAVQAKRIQDDDLMDDLHRQLFALVTDSRWTHGATAAADAVLLGRFYGRFADHAVEIARRVVFQASGHVPATAELAAR